MKIEEVEEVTEVTEEAQQVTQIVSETNEPVVEEEGVNGQKVKELVKEEVKQEVKAVEKKFVKLNIEEVEGSSDEEKQEKENIDVNQRITQFDKDMLKTEKMSSDFISSLNDFSVEPEPTVSHSQQTNEESKQSEIVIEETKEEANVEDIQI